jgi:effector-binding domain-containing protein
MPKNGTMYFEPGVIVARAFDSDGDVVHSHLPGGRAVKHVLVGPFEKLPQAWPTLFAWCASHGLKLEGAFWQVYRPTAVDPARQENDFVRFARLSRQCAGARTLRCSRVSWAPARERRA